MPPITVIERIAIDCKTTDGNQLHSWLHSALSTPFMWLSSEDMSTKRSNTTYIG